MGFCSRPMVSRPPRREPMRRRKSVTALWSTPLDGRTIALPGLFPVAQGGMAVSLGVDVVGRGRLMDENHRGTASM